MGKVTCLVQLGDQMCGPSVHILLFVVYGSGEGSVNTWLVDRLV